MKCAVVGSRSFTNFELLKEKMNEVCSEYKIDTIVSGGANGADTLAEHFAKFNDLKLEIYKADWKTYGKSAGFIRNKLIVDNCNLLVAFWDNKSKGTKSSIDLAEKLGKKVIIFNF